MQEIDVRPDIAAGQEPFPRIMAAVHALTADESLLLVAPFEPVPLLGVLTEQGFAHETTPQPDGSWHVTLRRASAGS